MIQETNRNARIAAEKFAGDSVRRVGRIHHVVQGRLKSRTWTKAPPIGKACA